MCDVSTTIEWKVPCDGPAKSERAKAALALAQATLSSFESKYSIRCNNSDHFMPRLAPADLSVAEVPFRTIGYYVEYELHEAKGSQNLDMDGSYQFAFSKQDHYSVKFLQKGIMDHAHAENAAKETILETRILMNLKVHPNICQIYGICSYSLGESLLTSGRNGFFFISDHISETLPERMSRWRAGKGYSCGAPEITQRLQVALQIISALVHLQKQKLVCYIRPDKVGFDAREDKVKLFSLGQATELGAMDHPESITSSDSISVLAFTAPEVLCGGPTSSGTDVFGMAVMLWELFCLEQAFDGFDRVTHYQKVVLEHARPETNELWETNSAELLRLSWNPFNRTTLESMYTSLETMLLYQDPISDLLDVAKAKQAEKAKANDAVSKLENKPLHSDLCFSEDTLKELLNVEKAKRVEKAKASDAASLPSQSDLCFSEDQLKELLDVDRAERAKDAAMKQHEQPSQSDLCFSEDKLKDLLEVDRSERAKANDAALKQSDFCLSEDTLKDLEEMLMATATKLKAARQAMPSSKTGKNKSIKRRKSPRLSRSENPDSPDSSGLDTDFSIVSANNILYDSFATASEQGTQEKERQGVSREVQQGQRSGSFARRTSKLGKQLSSKSIKMGIDKEEMTKTHQKNSTGNSLVDPESEKAPESTASQKPRQSPRTPRRRSSRAVRRTSSKDALVAIGNSRMPKRRSSRDLDRGEAPTRSSLARDRPGRSSSKKATRDFNDDSGDSRRSFHRSNSSPERGSSRSLDQREAPAHSSLASDRARRSLSHDDFIRILEGDEEKIIEAAAKLTEEKEQPKIPLGGLRKNRSNSLRTRSLSHDDIVRILNEDEEKTIAAAAKVAEERERPKRPSLLGGLRKMGISSSRLFGGSSRPHMLELEDGTESYSSLSTFNQYKYSAR